MYGTNCVDTIEIWLNLKKIYIKNINKTLIRGASKLTVLKWFCLLFFKSSVSLQCKMSSNSCHPNSNEMLKKERCPAIHLNASKCDSPSCSWGSSSLGEGTATSQWEFKKRLLGQWTWDVNWVSSTQFAFWKGTRGQGVVVSEIKKLWDFRNWIICKCSPLQSTVSSLNSSKSEYTPFC